MATTTNDTESDYYKLLSIENKHRYKTKISKINDIDPYTLKKNDFNYEPEDFPNISHADILTYLLFAPSPVTKEQLKSYKSLEAYKHL